MPQVKANPLAFLASKPADGCRHVIGIYQTPGRPWIVWVGTLKDCYNSQQSLVRITTEHYVLLSRHHSLSEATDTARSLSKSTSIHYVGSHDPHSRYLRAIPEPVNHTKHICSREEEITAILTELTTCSMIACVRPDLLIRAKTVLS